MTDKELVQAIKHKLGKYNVVDVHETGDQAPFAYVVSEAMMTKLADGPAPSSADWMNHDHWIGKEEQ